MQPTHFPSLQCLLCCEVPSPPSHLPGRHQATLLKGTILLSHFGPFLPVCDSLSNTSSPVSCDDPEIPTASDGLTDITQTLIIPNSSCGHNSYPDTSTSYLSGSLLLLLLKNQCSPLNASAGPSCSLHQCRSLHQGSAASLGCLFSTRFADEPCHCSSIISLFCCLSEELKLSFLFTQLSTYGKETSHYAL